MENGKQEVIICECNSPEHQILVQYDEDEDTGKMVFLSIHLVKSGFFRRLKYGIKYIFGYKCQYGAFDEVILSPKDSQKFQDITNHLKS